MSVTKDRKKQLKAPDQFQKQAMGMFDWLLKNKSVLYGTVGGIAVVVFAILGFGYFSEQNQNKRLEAFGEIQLQYNAEEDAAAEIREGIQKQIADIDSKIEALKNPAQDGEKDDGKDGEKAEANIGSKENNKPAKKLSKAEQAELDKKVAELEKQKDPLREKMEAVKADHQKSAEAFEKFFTSNNNAIGWRAGLRAGAVFLEKKQYDRAKQIIEKIVSQTNEKSFYKIHSSMILANIHDQLGEYDKAIQIIDKTLNFAPKDMQANLLLNKARLLTQIGGDQDKKKANDLFDQIIKDHTASQEAKIAKSLKSLQM